MADLEAEERAEADVELSQLDKAEHDAPGPGSGAASPAKPASDEGEQVGISGLTDILVCFSLVRCVCR